MKALIMAGGFGKRLRPLTNRMPKPMIKVGGKPIIYWQIKWLESNGIHDFVLLGGYRANMLISYIKSIGYSSKFEFSIEKKALGTGGSIKNAEGLLKGEKSFLVVNGDNITNINTGKMELNGRYICSISMVPYRSTKGIVEYRQGRVTGFSEKPLIKGYWINAGVTLASTRILNELPEEGSLEIDVFPTLAKAGRLSCTKFGSVYFNAVDSFKDLEEIDKDLKSGRVSF